MTDDDLIARLRNAPADGLGTENLCLEGADRIEALVKARREDALELLAAHGQAQEAYEAQLKAEARAEQLAATNEALVKDKRWIIEERDRTFALMLARAERLEAALRLLHDNVVLAFPTLADLGPVANARAALKGDDHE